MITLLTDKCWAIWIPIQPAFNSVSKTGFRPSRRDTEPFHSPLWSCDITTTTTTCFSDGHAAATLTVTHPASGGSQPSWLQEGHLTNFTWMVAASQILYQPMKHRTNFVLLKCLCLKHISFLWHHIAQQPREMFTTMVLTIAFEGHLWTKTSYNHSLKEQ